jgi:hypothetical protein
MHMREIYRFFNYRHSGAVPKEYKSVDARKNSIRGSFVFWPETASAVGSPSGRFPAKYASIGGKESERCKRSWRAG